MNKNKYSGFTLLELMIVVAIVGILASIGMTAYGDYMIRTQAAEGFSLAQGAEMAVNEHFAQTGVLASNNQQASFSGAVGKYISDVSISNNGVVVATFGNDANVKIKDKAIRLSPQVTNNGNLNWLCSSDVSNKYVPKDCQGVN